MWSFRSFAGALLVLAAVAAPALAAPARPPAATTARVVMPTVALGAPRAGARPVMRLSGATAWTGAPQRLLVTGEHRDPRGRAWVRVLLPVRPNGTSGWVPADRMRLVPTRVRFVIHLGARRLDIWRAGRRIDSFRAGIGRPGTPTPVGRFAIQDPVRTLPGWRGVYGAWTLVLTAHSPTLRTFMGGDATVAIHGAGAAGAARVGVPSSHGCVILGESDLAIAARYAAAGTPVDILP